MFADKYSRKAIEVMFTSSINPTHSIPILGFIWEKIGKKLISTDNGRYGCQLPPKKSKDQLGLGKSFPRGVIKTRGLITQNLPKVCCVWYQMKGNLILNQVSDVHFVILSSCEKLHLI